MQMLGYLVVSGGAVLWPIVHLVRIVLDHRLDSEVHRQVLQRVPDDQIVPAIRALNAGRRSQRK